MLPYLIAGAIGFGIGKLLENGGETFMSGGQVKEEWNSYSKESRVNALVKAGYVKNVAKNLSLESWDSLEKQVQNAFKNVLISREVEFMKGMMESVYTYSRLDKDDKYLAEYKKSLGNELFNRIFDEYKKELEEGYYVDYGTYTDWEGLTYNSLRKKFANGGSADLDYNEIFNVLKSKIDDAIDDIPNKYESASQFTGEEIEHESRSGFIPYTDGGYQAVWFETLGSLYSSGYTLPTKPLTDKMNRQIDFNLELARESFISDYPEIVEELGEENIDYNSLVDAGYQSEAEEFSNAEMDMMWGDTILMRILANYYNPENSRAKDGKHTIRLFGDVNLESPYHRTDNLDDSDKYEFTFDSIAELEKEMNKGIKQVISWFEGDMYNDSKTEMKVRRMNKGGTAKYGKGGGIQKGYNVFNYTDNVYATDEVFKTKKLANEFIKEFRNRFSRQGYYRDNQMNKIAIEDIDLLAIPSDFSPFRKFADGGDVNLIGISKEDYFLVVHNWVYFTFNYPHNFVKNAINSKHLEEKFSSSYTRYGSVGVLMSFWANLDNENRRILSLWIKNNYFNSKNDKSKLLSISDDDYAQIITHWNRFCFNFPYSFISKVFGENTSHFEQKWVRAYESAGSTGAVNKFFTELSGNYQRELTDWVYDNYKGSKLYAGGGSVKKRRRSASVQYGTSDRAFDKELTAKPVGYRFTNAKANQLRKDPYDKPTEAQVKKYLGKGIYKENRKNRSDRDRITKL